MSSPLPPMAISPMAICYGLSGMVIRRLEPFADLALTRDESGSYTAESYTISETTNGPGDLESAGGGGLYWTDTNRIYRTDNYWWRQETYQSEPISMGIQGPTSIALDLAGDRMYWGGQADQHHSPIRAGRNPCRRSGCGSRDSGGHRLGPGCGKDVLGGAGHRGDPACRPRWFQRRNPRGSRRSDGYRPGCHRGKDVLDCPGGFPFL